jgi:hypothetical protein
MRIAFMEFFMVRHLKISMFELLRFLIQPVDGHGLSTLIPSTCSMFADSKPGYVKRARAIAL